MFGPRWVSRQFPDLEGFSYTVYLARETVRSKGQRVQIRKAALLAIAFAILPGLALSQPAEDFFKSASPSMIVGSGAGGGYDIIGRLVARHMSRFLPGAPTMVVRNMPGAAGVQRADFLYNTAPK